MKVLLIQYNHAGDVLISSVIPNNLKKIYPDIKIDFLCNKEYMGVLQKNPSIDRIIAIDNKHIKSVLSLYKYMKLVRSERYDFLIDLSQNFSSIFLTFFSKAQKKLSYNTPILNKFYTNRLVKVNKLNTQTCNLLENRLAVLDQFLNDQSISIDPVAKIFLSQEEILEAKTTMLNAGIKFTRPIIMLGIFGTEKHTTWTIGSMAKLIDFIWSNYRADLLLNYLPNQHKELNELLSLLNSNTKVFVQPVGKSIREYASLMKNCTLFIGNNSRFLAITKALQKPTFGIYAPFVYKQDIACYENQYFHKSIHLSDILPRLYENFYPNELKKESSKFYLMLSSEFVIIKIKPFLKSYLSTFNKI
ncbi:lipopolysaccharide heptosyltransferase family protein [Apibacter muscae]|uniref:glycosyltransferase family 9 protein n=1 Tax=Apibacter muscae TaxID=2509004 RepID=UPI0011ADBF58|nr:glycosyltransferase family 9 protein [Apibacter muscae]TWP24906.1 lipopolysaccharide heptosyltransferase family protein [Apibacter muscae]